MILQSLSCFATTREVPTPFHTHRGIIMMLQTAKLEISAELVKVVYVGFSASQGAVRR